MAVYDDSDDSDGTQWTENYGDDWGDVPAQPHTHGDENVVERNEDEVLIVRTVGTPSEWVSTTDGLNIEKCR